MFKKHIGLIIILLTFSVVINTTAYACEPASAYDTEATEVYVCSNSPEYVDLLVAAEVLGISCDELAELLKTKSLYQILDDASKITQFKRAMIKSFTKKVTADFESGKINKTKSEKLIQKFSKKMNSWEG